MDISINKKSSTEALIKVKLIASDYQPKVDEKVKDYAKKASIKGFRAGKVPHGLIKKMYGKAILVEEVNHVLSHALTDYIKENDLNILGEPLPDKEQSSQIDWDNQTDFEFDYNIGLVNDFDVDVSKKQKVKSYSIKVDKSAIDETLENVKQQFGNATHPEKSQTGDSFFGTFTEKEGELTGDAFIKFNNIAKKEQKKFDGLEKGQAITLQIDKAFEDLTLIGQALKLDATETKDLKGKFDFEVKEITRVESPEMNQELFDKVFGPGVVDSEQAFLDKIESTISDNYSRETEFMLERDIADHFVDKTKIELPEAFLKEWLIISNDGKITEDDVDKEFDGYKKELKWSLIKNKIAEENEVNVENDEITAKAKEMIVQQFGGSPQMIEQLGDKMDEIVNNYLQAEKGENYMRVFNMVKGKKIIDLIKEKITLTDKKVDLEEFKKLATAE